MCVLAFQADLLFWDIDDTILETCCRERYERQLATVNQEMEAECFEMQEDAPEMFSPSWTGRLLLGSLDWQSSPYQISEADLGPDGAPGVLLHCQHRLLHLDDVRHRLHGWNGSQHDAGPQGGGP